MPAQTDDLGLGEPRVSSLEQASPPYWNRSLYRFKLQPDYDKEEITRILKEALEATFAELPVFKAQLVPMNDGEQQGKYDLVPGGNGELFVKDLRSTSLDHDQLRVKGFPLSTFDDRTFWGTPALPSPGDKITVFSLHANFIQGGLLLGLSMWHLVMDGIALATAL